MALIGDMLDLGVDLVMAALRSGLAKVEKECQARLDEAERRLAEFEKAPAEPNP